MKKIINNMSGVTLFALTITIIVLLILTGVTSSVILSQNGIIENATKAREEATIVEEMEQIDTAYSATTIRQTSRTTITTDDATKLQEELFKNVDGITVSVDIDEDGTKGFLVKFEKTGHYYFIENNEVRPATEEEFNDEITEVYALLYKKDTEYDLRFYKTCPSDDLPQFDENGWELVNDFKSDTGYQNISKTHFSVDIANNIDTRPWASYINNITSVTFKEKIVPTLLVNWFNNCENLTTINNIGKLHTYHVTYMSYMFYKCYNLKNLDISTFETQNVTNMADMFAYCTSLTELDLSNFNTENVTNMFHMFSNCSSLQSLILDGWNTEKVANMSGMFAKCSNLSKLDLSSFKTPLIENMYVMFIECSNLQLIDMRNFTFDKLSTGTSIFPTDSPIKVIVQNDAKNWLQNNVNIGKVIITTVDELITE